MVAHACNPSTLGGRGRQISEFEASLVYRVSSRTARAIQRKKGQASSCLANDYFKKILMVIIKRILIEFLLTGS